MKSIFKPFLLLLFSVLLTTASFSQKEEQEITIELKKGDTLHFNSSALNSISKLINPDDIKSITITRVPLSGNNNGLGFSIKSDSVWILGNNDSLILKGSPSFLLERFSTQQTYLGVGTASDDKGAKVMEVVSGSPAEKAGILKDDIITKVEDKVIDGPETLSEVIRSMKPDQKVTISVIRNGKTLKLTAVLGVKTSSGIDIPPLRNFRFRMPNLYDNNPSDWNNLFVNPGPQLGLQVQDTENNDGVTVLKVTPNSPAEAGGLKEGDLITEINGKKISGVSDIIRETEARSPGSEFKLQVTRNQKPLTLTIKIPKKLRKADL